MITVYDAIFPAIDWHFPFFNPGAFDVVQCLSRASEPLFDSILKALEGSSLQPIFSSIYKGNFCMSGLCYPENYRIL